MIVVSRPRELDAAEAAEVRALLDLAAGEDAEAGFSTACAAASRGGVRLLALARFDGTRDDVAGVLVAYLRLDVAANGVGTAQLVVHPEFRSLGVGTLLLERLGPELVAATGRPNIEIWAHGVHPAAERMARRFGAVATQRVWKVAASLRDWADPGSAGPAVKVSSTSATAGAAALADLTPCIGTSPEHLAAQHPADAARLDAADEHLVATNSAGEVVGALRFGPAPGERVGTIAEVAVRTGESGQAVETALIADAVFRLRSGGARTAEMWIDSADAGSVSLARRMGFAHEQSDVRFRLTALVPRVRAG
ncbi:MAG: GNAT family N-acetyltransferase [Sporichthyaceae bacterium]